MSTKNYLAIILLVYFACIGCNKEKFLDERPDKAVIVPTTIADFQQILDNEALMNGTTSGVIPSLGELAADGYYMINGGFSLATSRVSDKNLYLWSDDIGENANDDWLVSYKTVFYSNIALDGCSNFPKSNERDNVEGSALFYRSHVYYQLSQIFAVPYDKRTSNTDLGIPLRKTSKLDEKLERSSVQETYNQIINDLQKAKLLLPAVPKFKTRPSQLSVIGLLARVYLSMGKYDSAFKYANAFIMEKSDLLDYNTVSNLPNYNENPEVIWQGLLISHTLLTSTRNRIDSLLYLSFADDDLRKTLFFRSATNPKGGRFRMSYDGSSAFWGGIATDEMFLIRAECNARFGKKDDALNDLNFLVQKRWRNSVIYPEIQASSSSEALEKILHERRKELIFRGVRWTDLRRLNKEGMNIELVRKIDGGSYSLPSNSTHYTFLIPPSAMLFNPSWLQNPR